MIDTPHVTQAAAVPAAVLHLTVPRAEIQSAMGPAMAELKRAVAAPAGPMFAHHLRMSRDTFDFELGLPASGPVAAEGRVRPGELPAARVARTVFHGGYEGLHAAWAELDAWIAAQGHTPAPELWECYVTGPESSPDPADWRTELNRPLLG